jgi:integrase
MILVAYRHGLRASEVCDLQWQQIELGSERSWPIYKSRSMRRRVSSLLWRVERRKMTRTELIIQLLKVAIGLAFGAYFVWWSLEVLDRLTPEYDTATAMVGRAS